ncbi:MAG: phospholipase effector Tle1 domain-containing protein [Rhodobacterales bacterium]
MITGSGINQQIQQVYGALANRYRPGDQIFLIGCSRGAFWGKLALHRSFKTLCW